MPVDNCYTVWGIWELAHLHSLDQPEKIKTWAKETVYDTIFAHFTADLPYSTIKTIINYNKYEYMN